MKSSFKTQPVGRKHVPQRTCVGCRETKAKRELIRIVCKPSGGIEIDFSGKGPGRGAYLCPKRECWEFGLKKNRLGHALRVKISSEDYQRLLEYSHSLPQGGPIES